MDILAEITEIADIHKKMLEIEKTVEYLMTSCAVPIAHNETQALKVVLLADATRIRGIRDARISTLSTYL